MRERPSDDLAETWRLAIRLGWLVREHMESACAAVALSPAQAHALRELEPGRPMAMGDLAQRLRCDASNVTGIVDRLEARGLVERRPARGDRRIKVLVVTATGRAVRREFLSRLEMAPVPLSLLPLRQRQALAEVLRRIVPAD